MNDGIRTHDRLDHNQELYQLSYVHHGTGRSPPLRSIAKVRWRVLRARGVCEARAVGLIRRRGDGWTWEGVSPRSYASGAERHTLVSGGDGARDVEMRFFRIPAGGASALEAHPHEHTILILHGRAEVLLGEEIHAAAEGDAVWVASGEPHQLRAVGDDALGFLCTALVDR